MELLGINRGLDPQTDDLAHVKQFIKQFHLTMPIALSGSGKNNPDDAFGIVGSPTNVVVDPSGKVTAVFEGYDEDGLLKAIRALGFNG